MKTTLAGQMASGIGFGSGRDALAAAGASTSDDPPWSPASRQPCAKQAPLPVGRGHFSRWPVSSAPCQAPDGTKWQRILRKEVIQPQVPLRLPCYDFTPVADLTVGGCVPCGFAHRLKVKPTPMV